MKTDHADLVQILVNLWGDYSNSPGEYEQLLWRSGEVLQPMVQRQRSIAAADRCLAELAPLLAAHLGRTLDLPRLIDCVLIYRAFPDGVPPLSWGHLCLLARIKDRGIRTLYEREVRHRAWTDVQLDRAIRAGTFTAFRLPDPNWRAAAAGDVVQVAQTAKGLAVVRCLDLVSAEHDVDSDTESNKDLRWSEVDWRTGVQSDLGRTRGSIYSVEIGSAGGVLYRRAANGLECLEGGQWRLILPGGEWTLCRAPLSVADMLVTVWDNQDMFDAKFRIAVLTGELARWSEIFEGGPFYVVASGAGIVIRVCSRGADSQSWSLRRIELASLRQVGSAPVVDGGVLLAQGGQLLAASRQLMRTAEDELRDVKKPARAVGENETRIMYVGQLGLTSRDVVACFESHSLAPVRQWTVGGAPIALQALPNGRGLVVSTERKIQAIVPGRARSVLLAEWSGSVLGEPIRLGNRLAWLVRRKCRVNYETSTLVSTPGSDQDDYVLEILDFATGVWSYLPFESATHLSSMHLCGEAIVFVGAHEVLAYDAVRLLDAAVRDTERPVFPLGPSLEVDRVISGLALSGPIDQQWASEAVPELARDLLPPQELVRWLGAGDANHRFRLWQRRVDEDLAQVTGWPDFIDGAARKCPNEFLTIADAFEGESSGSPAFDATSIAWPKIQSVLEWKRGIESDSELTVDGADAQRCARTLLYENVMRCASARSLEVVRATWGSQGVAFVNELAGGALESLAWLTIGQEPAAKPRSDYFGLGRLVAKIAATVHAPAPASEPVALHALQRLRSGWPDGCPLLIENTETFVGFVQDCAREGLLARDARSRLQSAVAKAWEQPAVNRGQMVFVSYSHQQADLARKLADGLSALGVGAVLDRYELGRDATGAALETWIAESMMRTVTTVYLLSEDVRRSGWVHRESEWQMRVLGTKPSLILPYIVSFEGLKTSTSYPRSRTIDGTALLKSPETTIRQLAGRLTLDWLLTLKARRFNQNFGIAYRGERVIEIVAKPESTSLA
jgi:hypothetical protein